MSCVGERAGMRSDDMPSTQIKVILLLLLLTARKLSNL